MILWHVVLAIAGVRIVFGDPRMDVRVLAVGALLPLLVDLPLGHRAVGHSLLFCVAMLVVVMVVTTGRRPLRRQLLPLPIGAFVSLVLDGMWAQQHVFLWPLQGSWGHESLLPAAGWVVVEELVGLVVAVGLWRRCGLDDPARRRRLWREGRLEAVDPATGVAP